MSLNWLKGLLLENKTDFEFYVMGNLKNDYCFCLTIEQFQETSVSNIHR